jgi:hypothetical protein
MFSVKDRKWNCGKRWPFPGAEIVYSRKSRMVRTEPFTRAPHVFLSNSENWEKAVLFFGPLWMKVGREKLVLSLKASVEE